MLILGMFIGVVLTLCWQQASASDKQDTRAAAMKGDRRVKR